jgi:hypothetical protein
VQVEATTLTGRRVDAMVSRSTDGRFDTLQMEVEDSAGTELVRAGQRGTRIIVTSTGPTGRRTRELPAGDFVVLLDESLHGLLYIAAELATPSGQALTGLYVRTGRRASFTATRRDMGSRGSAVDLGRHQRAAAARLARPDAPPRPSRRSYRAQSASALNWSRPSNGCATIACALETRCDWLVSQPETFGPGRP